MMFEYFMKEVFLWCFKQVVIGLMPFWGLVYSPLALKQLVDESISWSSETYSKIMNSSLLFQSFNEGKWKTFTGSSWLLISILFHCKLNVFDCWSDKSGTLKTSPWELVMGFFHYFLTIYALTIKRSIEKIIWQINQYWK